MGTGEPLEPWYRARSRADIGSAVRKARQRRGANQIDIAARAGVSRSTLQRLERGDDVSLDAVLAVLAELGLEAILVSRGAQLTVGPR
jgi:transcriptional regulator with XRE-family HTH domain